MNVSLVIVTHNVDELFVVQSKQITNPLFSEVVIINTGKKDISSLTNLKLSNLRVFDHEFQNDLPQIKNIGIQQATGDWILTIDTDELFEDSLLAEVPQLIINDEIDGYWFRRKTFIDSKGTYLKHGLFYPDWQLRLFRRRREYLYSGGVHALLPIPQQRTKEISLDLLHYPTNPKYQSFANFKNFLPYIYMDAAEYTKKSNSAFKLIILGIKEFINLFFGGYLRGKGFLDGWAGFRAHLLFASYISAIYFFAAHTMLFRSNKV